MRPEESFRGSRDCDESFSRRAHHLDAAIMMEAAPNSIMAALRRLFLMRDAEREVIGKNSRSLVEERFNWSRIGRQMPEVYD